MMGGVCFHPAGCLTSIPVLELAGYWVWPGLGVKMVVSRRAHASQYSLRSSSPVSLLSIVSHIPLLSPQETYQDPQTGPDQALMKSLFCAEFQCLPNFVCALQKWTLLPQVLWDSCTQALLAFKAKWGLCLLIPDPQTGEPDGLRTFTPAGDPLQYNEYPVCGSPTQ